LNSSAEEGGYKTSLRRIARGAGRSFFSLGIGRAVGFATQIVLARVLGPTQLGFYVLGLAIVILLGELARFGLDIAAVRFVARYRAERDISRMRGTILLALGASFVVSLAFSIALFLTAGFLAGELFGDPALETVIRAFSIAVPFFTLVVVAAAATEGFETVRYSVPARQILQPVVNSAFIVVFYLLGYQVLGAVTAYIISMVCAAVYILYRLLRLFPELLDRETPPIFEIRLLLGVSGAGTVSIFAEYANIWTATIVLGIFSTAEEVGIYNPAARTALLFGIVYVAFGYIFSPIISSRYSSGMLRELSNLYRDVSRWIFIGGLSVCLPIILLSKDILAIFGEEFVAGWVVTSLIAAAMLLISSAGATNQVLLMTGYQGIYTLAFVSAAIVGIAGSFVLVPVFGMLGAALACAGSYVVPNIITLAAIRKRLDLWPYSHQYLKPLIAALFAVAVILAAKLLVPISAGLPTMLLFVPLYLVSFAVMLLGLGLTASDREFLRAIWTAVRQ
jgi:O-antigen/teichoic acid export membrane protein